MKIFWLHTGTFETVNGKALQMATVNYCNCSLFRFRRTWAVVAILTFFVLSRFVSAKKLSFSESTFKIAIFADLHYGENAWTDWGPLQDKRSNHVMSSVIDAENPDFVIFLGDLITANNIPVKNASKYWQEAIAVTKSRNISWASLLGNHDDMAFEWPEEWFGNSGVPMIDCPSSPFLLDSDIECYFQRTTRAELMWLDMKEPLSYSSMGKTSLWPSVSNYVLEVASKKDPNVPAVLLYFLDSGGGSYPEVISSIQAKWFNETSAQKNPDSRIPEVIFWHIPSQAYKKVAPWTHLTIRKPCVGSINLERVASQVAEWGIMDVLVHKKSVKAIIVGHNHGLDWCCPFKSTWLCFARHTGYGGYGSWPRGARILEFHENPFSVNSWIRMEDGSTHSNIDLTNEFKP